MIFKCKPVYNFQSVEFEMEIKDDATTKEKQKAFEDMWDMYKCCIVELTKIAPEQPAPVKAAAKPSEPMATPKQIDLLVNSFGMVRDEAKKLTQKQASFKINEFINK